CGTRPESSRQYRSPRGWPEPRSTGARGGAGRRAPIVRLASRPRWAQARTADRHARRPRAPRRAPIPQRRRTAPLPPCVTRAVPFPAGILIATVGGDGGPLQVLLFDRSLVRDLASEREVLFTDLP